MTEIAAELPGSEIVREGLADIEAGRETAASLVVAMAAPRLRALGIEVPDGLERGASHRLYELLSTDGAGAHSRYNALVRRIVSFARAAEHASAG